MARFDIAAWDAEGRRRNANDLRYQIYEEGRSFDWYQAEDRWNYKPLPQQRRLGGDSLAVKANGPNLIEWPLAAGSYRLDITNAEGKILSSLRFNGTWEPTQALTDRPETLPLTATLNGKNIRLTVTADKPNVATILLADDHVRHLLHKALPAGQNRNGRPGPVWG